MAITVIFLPFSAEPFGAAFAYLIWLVAAVLMLIMLLSGEDRGGAPTRWWQVARHAPPSAPAFLIGVAVLCVAIVRADGRYWQPDRFLYEALLVWVGCVLWGVWLHAVLTRRSIAAGATAGVAVLLPVGYALGGGFDGLGSQQYVAVAVLTPAMLLWLRALSARRASPR